MGKILPVSGVTAGAFVEESEAEGKVVGAGEVADEVRFIVSNLYSGLPPRVIFYLLFLNCVCF